MELIYGSTDVGALAKSYDNIVTSGAAYAFPLGVEAETTVVTVAAATTTSVTVELPDPSLLPGRRMIKRVIFEFETAASTASIIFQRNPDVVSAINSYPASISANINGSAANVTATKSAGNTVGIYEYVIMLNGSSDYKIYQNVLSAINIT